MTERIDQTSGDKPMQERLTVEELLERLKRVKEAGTGIDYKSIEGSGKVEFEKYAV